jgi:hypothetical protein
LTKRQDNAQRQIDANVASHSQDPAQAKRLEDLKEALAVLSGLEAKSPRDLDRYLGQIDQVLDHGKPFNRAAFKDAVGDVTAEQLYLNQKVSDLISNAEMDQTDYRRGDRPNVFFGAQKTYLGVKVNVFVWNTFVLIGSSIVLLGLLHWILRRQLQVRRS